AIPSPGMSQLAFTSVFATKATAINHSCQRRIDHAQTIRGSTKVTGVTKLGNNSRRSAIQVPSRRNTTVVDRRREGRFIDAESGISSDRCSVLFYAGPALGEHSLHVRR